MCLGRQLNLIISSLAFALSPTFTLLWIPMLIISKLSNKFYVFLDDKLYSMYQRGVIFLYEHLNNTKIIFYGDHDKVFGRKENVLYISNHQSTVDWVISDIIIARQGGIGRLRYVLKEELKYLPLYGFYFYNHGCIYVNRKQFEKEKAVRSFEYLRNNKISSWLVIFPEGTRFDESKKNVIENSKKFAESQGLKPLKYHLTPRTKGVELVLDNLGDILDAFYNITILFEDKENLDANKPWKRILPGMFEWFDKERVIHINIERIELRNIPLQGVALRKWLHNLFIQKDEMMNYIKSNELRSSDPNWPLKNPKQFPLPISETLPCYICLIAITLFLLCCKVGRLLYFGIAVGFSIFGIIYATFKL